jgi:hypothetical protein
MLGTFPVDSTLNVFIGSHSTLPREQGLAESREATPAEQRARDDAEGAAQKVMMKTNAGT